jgi:hypothetical protein
VQKFERQRAGTTLSRDESGDSAEETIEVGSEIKNWLRFWLMKTEKMLDRMRMISMEIGGRGDKHLAIQIIAFLPERKSNANKGCLPPK